jgi:hypothetical protein
MEVKEFIKSITRSVVEAVQESSEELNHEMYITHSPDNKSIEFDVAVTVENSTKGEAGINICNIVDIGGKDEYKSSSIHRVKLSIYIASSDKNKQQEQRAEYDRLRANL